MGEHRRLDDPYITHRLNNYNDDPVNRRIHEAGFANDGNSCSLRAWAVACADIVASFPISPAMAPTHSW